MLLLACQALIISCFMFLVKDTITLGEVQSIEVESTNRDIGIVKLEEQPLTKGKISMVVEEKIKQKTIEESISEVENTIPEEEVEEIKPIVYDNMTMDELATKLNRSLSSTLSGKGYLFAEYSIKLGIDPYLAVAIVLQETGCKWNCSYLVTHCNNVGGQKGGPSCGGGAYKSFPTLDEGIIGYLDNLYNNYYSKGLTDVYSIHRVYAEDPNWPGYVNNYIASIRTN